MPIPGMALCIIGHTIACAIKTRESQGEKRYYWLHSLVLVVLNSFGGGIIAYSLLGMASSCRIDHDHHHHHHHHYDNHHLFFYSYFFHIIRQTSNYFDE